MESFEEAQFDKWFELGLELEYCPHCQGRAHGVDRYTSEDPYPHEVFIRECDECGELFVVRD